MPPFSPMPVDVTAITAFHLLAGELEKQCITAYLSQRDRFDALHQVLKEAHAGIKSIAVLPEGCQLNVDCPPGYECNSGQCEVILNPLTVGKRPQKPPSPKKTRR